MVAAMTQAARDLKHAEISRKSRGNFAEPRDYIGRGSTGPGYGSPSRLGVGVFVVVIGRRAFGQ